MATLNQTLDSRVRPFSEGISSPEYWARRKRWSYSEVSCHQQDRHPRPSSVHRTNFSCNASSALNKTYVVPSTGNTVAFNQKFSDGSCFKFADHQGITNSISTENCDVKKTVQRELSLRSGTDCGRSRGIVRLGIGDKNLLSAKSNDFHEKTTDPNCHGKNVASENGSGRYEGFNQKGSSAQEVKGMSGIPRNDIREPRVDQHKTFAASRVVSGRDLNYNLGIIRSNDNAFEIPSYHRIQSDDSFKGNIGQELLLSRNFASGISYAPTNTVEISPSKGQSEHLHSRKTDLKPPTGKAHSENKVNTNNKNGFCNFSTQAFAQKNSVHQNRVSNENRHNSGLPTAASVLRLTNPGQETSMTGPHTKVEAAGEDCNLSSVDWFEASQSSVRNVGASANCRQLTVIEKDRKHCSNTGLHDKENRLRILENSADIEVSGLENRFGSALQNGNLSLMNKARTFSSIAKTTDSLKSTNGWISSAMCDSVHEKQCSNLSLDVHHRTNSAEVVQHEDTGEIIAVNKSGNSATYDKSSVSVEKSSKTPAPFAISPKVVSKYALTLSEHTPTRTVVHANLMPKSEVRSSISYQVPTSASLLSGNPGSSYQVPTSASLLSGNPGLSYQVPTSAFLLSGNPGSGYQVPTSAFLLSGNPGSSYQVPTFASLLSGNPGSSYQVPTSASLLSGNPGSSFQVPTSASLLSGNPGSSYQVPTSASLLSGNTGSSYQVPTSASLLSGSPGSSYQVPISASLLSGNPGSSYQVPTSASLLSGNTGSSYQVPTSASLLPHDENSGFRIHSATLELLPVRLEQSVVPSTSVIPDASVVSSTSVIPSSSVTPCESDKGRARTLLRSNKQEAEIGKQLRRTEADIQVLNEIIRDACQRLEAKCQLKNKLLEDRKRMLLERCQDADDVAVRDQASEFQNLSVPCSGVQAKDSKISASTSHYGDHGMTVRRIIPGGGIPPVKTVELSNYKGDSSLPEMKSTHANGFTTAERSENLVIKPTEEMRNTQMPNECSPAGFSGHSTSSISLGNELFSSFRQYQAPPCDLIHESQTDMKLESLLQVPNRCEPGLQGDKYSLLGENERLILPERDLIAFKKEEKVSLPERPRSVSEHHKTGLYCKSAQLQTPFSLLSASTNVAQLVSIGSGTFSPGFSTYFKQYSFDPLDFEGKDQNIFSVFDSVKGSLCYNKVPIQVQVQSLQGAQTKEDKLSSCSALGSPIQKRKSRKARDKRRCSAGLSMVSSEDSSDCEACQATDVLRASSPVLSKKQRRKRRSPVEQLLKDYLHQVSSSDIDIDGLELPAVAKLKSPTS